MIRLNNVFLLHGTEAFLNSASPYDSYLMLYKVTLNGGSASLDLSEVLNDSSKCEYILLKSTNTDNNGKLDVDNTAIADSDTVTVLIFTDAHNIKNL